MRFDALSRTGLIGICNGSEWCSLMQRLIVRRQLAYWTTRKTSAQLLFINRDINSYDAIYILHWTDSCKSFFQQATGWGIGKKLPWPEEDYLFMYTWKKVLHRFPMNMFSKWHGFRIVFWLKFRLLIIRTHRLAGPYYSLLVLPARKWVQLHLEPYRDTLVLWKYF